jgi:hypothetical protein
MSLILQDLPLFYAMCTREAAVVAKAECPVEFENQLLEVNGLGERALNQAGRGGGIGHCWGYIEAKLSPVRFRFVFSTGTYFQQLPRFVFRFVFGYLCSLFFCFQQLLRFVF